ncbi:putative GPCR family 3 protein [Plasmopara halstedii]
MSKIQLVEAQAPPTEVAVSTDDVNFTTVKPHKSSTTKKNEYRVLCCGNSWQDLLIIPLCIIGVYALLGALFALCTRSVLQTDDTNTALWVFFVFYAFFVFLLASVLGTVAYNRKMLKAHENDDPENL